MTAPRPTNEKERLEALRSYEILDSEPEAAFDDLALVASKICDTPIALVSLVDEDRQWFKARVGLARTETPRDQAFCAHVIMDDVTLVVPDAAQDERFRDNPLVRSDPNIRFYAGAPLLTSDGLGLGTLCVIDPQPRTGEALRPAQIEALEALARHASRLLEHRRVAAQLAGALSRVKLLEELVPICAWCKGIMNADEHRSTIEEFLQTHSGFEITHGLCAECEARLVSGAERSG
jgi:GAF domain-containing protein